MEKKVITKLIDHLTIAKKSGNNKQKNTYKYAKNSGEIEESKKVCKWRKKGNTDTARHFETV